MRSQPRQLFTTTTSFMLMYEIAPSFMSQTSLSTQFKKDVVLASSKFIPKSNPRRKSGRRRASSYSCNKINYENATTSENHTKGQGQRRRKDQDINRRHCRRQEDTQSKRCSTFVPSGASSRIR